MAQTKRLVALDVFRGATVALMILVNNPGSWGAIYPPLKHADWFGWTPTDFVFPFFLYFLGSLPILVLSLFLLFFYDSSEINEISGQAEFS